MITYTDLSLHCQLVTVLIKISNTQMQSVQTSQTIIHNITDPKTSLPTPTNIFNHSKACYTMPNIWKQENSYQSQKQWRSHQCVSIETITLLSKVPKNLIIFLSSHRIPFVPIVHGFIPMYSTTTMLHDLSQHILKKNSMLNLMLLKLSLLQ